MRASAKFQRSSLRCGMRWRPSTRTFTRRRPKQRKRNICRHSRRTERLWLARVRPKTNNNFLSSNRNSSHRRNSNKFNIRRMVVTPGTEHRETSRIRCTVRSLNLLRLSNNIRILIRINSFNIISNPRNKCK